MKGAEFEREICKSLSKWWSNDKDDSIFWRSAQSGGRATIRSRQGKRTAGAYGDITALDPIGNPLLKVFTIELKRGRNHGEPADLLDCPTRKSKSCHAFVKTLTQAIRGAKEAGSHSWLVISRRDFRHSVCFFDSRMLQAHQPLFHAVKKGLLKSPSLRVRIWIPDYGRLDFSGVRLDRFLKSVNPKFLALWNKERS